MPEVAIIVTAKDQASKVLGGIGDSLSNLGKVAAVGLGAGVAALGAMAAGATALALDAAKLEPLKMTFDSLCQSIGTTADEMLKKLKPAVMDLVGKGALMQTTSKWISMGLVQNADDAARLAEMGVKLGVAMGKDATEALETFGQMVALGTTRQLPQFGISIDAVKQRMEELTAANAELGEKEAFVMAITEVGGDTLGKMGDISDTATVKMQQFSRSIASLKTTIGEALLPVLKLVIDTALVPLTEKIKELAPKIGYVIETFVLLAQEILSGDMQSAIGFLQNECWEVLDNLFGAEMADKITALGTKVLEFVSNFRTNVVPVLQDMAARVLPLLQRAIGFVIEHWQTFAKIGAVVGGAILAISSPMTAVIAALAGLAAAWATNWGGIQDKVGAVWGFLQPVFNAIGTVLGFIKDTILPAIAEAFSKVWGFIKDVVKAAWEGFKPSIEEMKEAFADFWLEMKPRLEEAWSAIREAMAKVMDWVKTTGIPMMRDYWNAMEPVRKLIVDLARDFGRFMGSSGVVMIKGFLSGLIYLWDSMTRAIRGVRDALNWLIGAIQRALDWLRSLANAVPSWLLGMSPSPLETSIRGIADAFRELGAMSGGFVGVTYAPAPVRPERSLNINIGSVYGMGGYRQAIEEAIWEANRYSL